MRLLAIPILIDQKFGAGIVLKSQGHRMDHFLHPPPFHFRCNESTKIDRGTNQLTFPLTFPFSTIPIVIGHDSYRDDSYRDAEIISYITRPAFAERVKTMKQNREKRYASWEPFPVSTIPIVIGTIVIGTIVIGTIDR
jgi:hypothetical protein